MVPPEIFRANLRCMGSPVPARCSLSWTPWPERHAGWQCCGDMTVLPRPSRIERDVDAPQHPGLGRILKHVRAEIDRDHISILAAGLAFYGLLSICPGMSALISIYGLVADPAVIGRQVAALSEVLPQNALQLLSDQLHSLIAAPPSKLGIGLIISLALALWSAASGTGTLMQALTVAYEETNTRGIIAFYLRAIALTIAIGIFGLISLFLIAVVPAVIDWLPISEQWRTSVALIRWPILAGLAFVALALVYRFAPARETPRWHWFSPGTVAAAVLWLIGSAGFSFYVTHFSSYDRTYGSLGAVVVLLMWLYVSAYIVLVGAELNSAIENPRR
jgi:membrane protein